MKFEPLPALIATALLVLGGCGQTGALYLPSDAPESTQETAGTADDTEDDDQPAATDDTP